MLVDPCRTGPTHALVFAGSGGFKTTSVGVPTLLTWTGSAVVLDPSREVGPMVARYRRQRLGHRVAFLDPAAPTGDGVNVLDWIDPASPLAESNVEAMVGWIAGEAPGSRADARTASSGAAFFRDSAKGLIACLLADLLWDPALTPAHKTLRPLRRRLVTPPEQMPELLRHVHTTSRSPMARDIAGSLLGLPPETFGGILANATRDTRWLSTRAYADLVSGGPEGTPHISHGGPDARPTDRLRADPAQGAASHARPRPRPHRRPAQRRLRGGRPRPGPHPLPAR